MRFKHLLKLITFQTVHVKAKTVLLHFLALTCTWGKWRKNGHPNFFCLLRRKIRESKRNCSGLQQASDCPHRRSTLWLPSCHLTGLLEKLHQMRRLPQPLCPRPWGSCRRGGTGSVWQGRSNPKGCLISQPAPCSNSKGKMRLLLTSHFVTLASPPCG